MQLIPRTQVLLNSSPACLVTPSPGPTAGCICVQSAHACRSTGGLTPHSAPKAVLQMVAADPVDQGHGRFGQRGSKVRLHQSLERLQGLLHARQLIMHCSFAYGQQAICLWPDTNMIGAKVMYKLDTVTHAAVARSGDGITWEGCRRGCLPGVLIGVLWAACLHCLGHSCSTVSSRRTAVSCSQQQLGQAVAIPGKAAVEAACQAISSACSGQPACPAQATAAVQCPAGTQPCHACSSS